MVAKFKKVFNLHFVVFFFDVGLQHGPKMVPKSAPRGFQEPLGDDFHAQELSGGIFIIVALFFYERCYEIRCKF